VSRIAPDLSPVGACDNAAETAAAQLPQTQCALRPVMALAMAPVSEL